MGELTAPVPAGRKPSRSIRARFQAAGLRQRLSWLFVFGALLLVILVAVNVVAFASLIGTRHTLLDNVDPANLASDQLFVSYLNEETGVRGYVLSGNSAFLQPFELGHAQAETSSSSWTSSCPRSRRCSASPVRPSPRRHAG